MALPIPVLKYRMFSRDGTTPLAGGKVYTYAAGTLNPQSTWTDSLQGTLNANPVILDQYGEANIWVGSESYKFAIYDSNDVLQYTVDNVINSGTTGSFSTVESISDLRNLPSGSSTFVYVGYNAVAADQGGGTFIWDSTSAGVDDNGTIITPSSLPPTGRWLRQYNGPMNVRWFGAIGNNSTDDYTAVSQAAAGASVAGKEVLLPNGDYLVGTSVSFPSNVPVRFEDEATLRSNGTVTITFAGDLAISTNQQTFYGANLSVALSVAASKQVQCSWFQSPHKAVAAIGSNFSSLVVASAAIQTGALVIPATTTLIVPLGGSFAASTPQTLTVNGPVIAGSYNWINSTITATFGHKSVILDPTWFNALNDDTAVGPAFLAACTSAAASGSKTLQLDSGSYYINATPIPLSSGIKIIGKGSELTTIRTAAGHAMFTIAAGVTDVTVSGLKLYCAALSTSDGITVTGLNLTFNSKTDSNITINDVWSVNISRPFTVTNASRVSFTNIRASLTLAVATSAVIRLFGCSDITVDGFVVDGNNGGVNPNYTGISSGIMMFNNGKVYGNKNVKISNVTCDRLIDRGICGETGFPEIYGGFLNVYFNAAGYTDAVPGDVGLEVHDNLGNTVGILMDYDNDPLNPVWNIKWRTPSISYASLTYGTTLSAFTGTGVGALLTTPSTRCVQLKNSSYTNAVPGDIGKNVMQGATVLGALVSYDNEKYRWYIDTTSAVLPNTATTINTGTGAGTSIVFIDYKYVSPCAYDNEWTDLTVTNANHTDIGEGIAIDNCWYTHVSNFALNYNNYTGIFVGDNPNPGSTISNGSCYGNRYGILIGQGPGVAISDCDFSYNSVNGLGTVIPSTGHRMEVDYTLITNCNITRNGFGASGTNNSGVRLEGNRALISNCNISENYNDGIFIPAASDILGQENVIEHCTINDNGWGKITTGDGVRIEGQAYNNIVRHCSIGRAFPNMSGQNYGIRTVTNERDGVFQNNYVVGNSTGPYVLDGARDLWLDNQVTYTTVGSVNGSGLTLRTSDATATRFGATTSGSDPAIEATSGATDATPTVSIQGSDDITDQGPFTAALRVENVQADFSGDLMEFDNATASDHVNSVNGGWLSVPDVEDLGCQLRIRRDGLQIGGTRAAGTVLKHVWSTAAALDFPNMAAQTTADLTVLVPGVYVTLTSQAGGYVSCVPTDIGKVVTGTGSGATGTLLSYDNATRVWVVSSLTLTFAAADVLSIAAGTGAGTVTTVALDGPVAGDDVVVTPNGLPEADLTWCGCVSAPNTVTVRLGNISAGAINPASRTYRITVRKFT